MEQKNTNYICHILLVHSIFNFLEGKWLRFVSGKEGRRRRGDVKFQFSKGLTLVQLFGAGWVQKGVGGIFLKIRPHSCM